MTTKALYVTSLHSFSGKTALCLGVGRRLQADGHKQSLDLKL